MVAPATSNTMVAPATSACLQCKVYKQSLRLQGLQTELDSQGKRSTCYVWHVVHRLQVANVWKRRMSLVDGIWTIGPKYIQQGKEQNRAEGKVVSPLLVATCRWDCIQTLLFECVYVLHMNPSDCWELFQANAACAWVAQWSSMLHDAVSACEKRSVKTSILVSDLVRCNRTYLHVLRFSIVDGQHPFPSAAVKSYSWLIQAGHRCFMSCKQRVSKQRWTLCHWPQAYLCHIIISRSVKQPNFHSLGRLCTCKAWCHAIKAVRVTLLRRLMPCNKGC